MKSHKTHAKSILPGLHSPLTLLDGLSPVLIGWMTIFGAWSAAVRTDGFVPTFVLRDFEQDGETITEEVIDELVAAGKWKREPRGIYIVDWEHTQAADHLEEKYHEELPEPAYNSEDAEAVHALVTASNDSDGHEGDNEPEDAGDVEPATEEDGTEADDSDDRKKFDFREDDEEDSAEEEEIANISVTEVEKKPSRFTDKELNNGYDEFLEIMIKRPEDHELCWELWCEDAESFGIDEVLDAADDYARSTGGKRRDSDSWRKRFSQRMLPDVWLEDGGVYGYIRKTRKNAKR